MFLHRESWGSTVSAIEQFLSEAMKSTGFTVSHILDTVDEPCRRDTENQPRTAKDIDTLAQQQPSPDNVKLDIVLQEAELWRKFHSLINEMIVTKNGR